MTVAFIAITFPISAGVLCAGIFIGYDRYDRWRARRFR